MKQKVNRRDTKHGLLDLPVANLDKYQGMAKGGATMKKVKPLTPGQKTEVMRGAMAAKQAQMSAAPPAPGAMPPGPPAPGPAMKKGGFVPFVKKGSGETGESSKGSKSGTKKGLNAEKDDKWTPPWAKAKKMASGGSVVCAAGGRIGSKGDGCISKGRTKGRMV